MAGQAFGEQDKRQQCYSPGKENVSPGAAAAFESPQYSQYRLLDSIAKRSPLKAKLGGSPFRAKPRAQKLFSDTTIPPPRQLKAPARRWTAAALGLNAGIPADFRVELGQAHGEELALHYDALYHIHPEWQSAAEYLELEEVKQARASLDDIRKQQWADHWSKPGVLESVYVPQWVVDIFVSTKTEEELVQYAMQRGVIGEGSVKGLSQVNVNIFGTIASQRMQELLNEDPFGGSCFADQQTGPVRGDGGVQEEVPGPVPQSTTVRVPQSALLELQAGADLTTAVTRESAVVQLPLRRHDAPDNLWEDAGLPNFDLGLDDISEGINFSTPDHEPLVDVSGPIPTPPVSAAPVPAPPRDVASSPTLANLGGVSKENVVPDVVQAAAKRVLETNKAMADGARRKALQDASAAAGPPAALTVMSDAALQDAITEKQNANTAKSTKQSLKRFHAWAIAQSEAGNPRATDFLIPLTEQTNEQLLRSVSEYVSSVRKLKPDPKNQGDPYAYPGATLKGDVLSIERHIREYVISNNRLSGSNALGPRLLCDPYFRPIFTALDNRCMEVKTAGLGTKRKQAAALSLDQELVFISSDYFDPSTPRGLFNLFCCEKLGLRGGQELYLTRLMDFELVTQPESGMRMVQYNHNTSKNHKGGLRTLSHPPRPPSFIIEIDPNNPRSDFAVAHKFLFEKNEGRDPTGPLFGTPLSVPPPGGWESTPKWYSTKAKVGLHTLSKVLKRGQEAAGQALNGVNITNHSGRASTVSRLWEHGYDMKAISDQTGHRSNAVEGYARPLVQHAIERSEALSVSTKRPRASLTVPPALALVGTGVAPALPSVGTEVARTLRPARVPAGAADIRTVPTTLADDASAVVEVTPATQPPGDDGQVGQLPFSFSGLHNCTFNFHVGPKPGKKPE